MPGPVITEPGADTYVTPGWSFTNTTGAALPADQAYAYPIFTPYDLTYDEVGYYLNWLPQAGSHLRVALYTSEGTSQETFRPGTLVEQWAIPSIDTTGYKGVATGGTLIGGTYYWLVYGSNHSTPQFEINNDDDAQRPASGGSPNILDGSMPGHYMIFEWDAQTSWIDDGFPNDLSGMDPDDLIHFAVGERKTVIVTFKVPIA